MIFVRVGDKNRCDRLAPQRREQGGNMVWTVRAWIDDRHFAGADNRSAGSCKRHRSGIAGDHPADQRRKLDEFAQTAVEGAVEEYHSGLVRGIDAIAHCRPRRQVAGNILCWVLSKGIKSRSSGLRPLAVVKQNRIQISTTENAAR